MRRILSSRERSLSGFTLLEMVVVMAIIAILVTVLVPTMSGYITKSRLSSANSEAKVLYNSIQTIMQEYEFTERQMDDSAFYGATKTGELFVKGSNGTITVATTGARNIGDFVYASGGRDVIGANLFSADAATFGARLSRLYSDYTSVSWAAYIEDYSVRGVFCADTLTTQYVGAYPMRASHPVGEAGCETGATIGGATMSDLKVYSASAWSVAAPPSAD